MNYALPNVECDAMLSNAEEARPELVDAAVLLVGRFDRMPRWRVVHELARRGGRVTRRLASASGLVIGHGAHLQLTLGTLPAVIESARQRGAWCLSERGFLRGLDLLPPRAPAHRLMSHADLARQAGLNPETVRLLALFDILDGDDGAFGFADLVVARGVRRLLDEGTSLARIVSTAVALQAQADGPGFLAQGRLVQLPDGDVALRIGRHVAEGDGQLQLPLDRAGNPSLDELSTAAETAEDEARWRDAEGFYRRILGVTPRDPVARFNLANVLRQAGRAGEAKRLLEEVVRLDPLFAEAWYNLAHLAEDRGDRAAARRCLERSIAIDPDYADAIYNLARLRMVSGDAVTAAALYERYLALDPRSRWAERARRSVALCRLMACRVPAATAPR
jgi:tetratricopeptide (TPR) repeat protein